MLETARNLFLILIPVGVIELVFTFLAMTFSYNRTGAKNFNFLTYFPFELNQFKRYQKSSWIYEILIILGSLILTFAFIFFGIYVVGEKKYVALVIDIILFIALFSFNLLFFVKLSAYQLHLTLAIIFSFSTLLSSTLELILFTNVDAIGILTSFQQIFIIVVSTINIFYMFVLLFNPSYKNWAKMVKIDAQTFNRPKRCYLAILEWGSLIAFFIDFVPLCILLI